MVWEDCQTLATFFIAGDRNYGLEFCLYKYDDGLPQYSLSVNKWTSDFGREILNLQNIDQITIVGVHICNMHNADEVVVTKKNGEKKWNFRVIKLQDGPQIISFTDEENLYRFSVSSDDLRLFSKAFKKVSEIMLRDTQPLSVL